MSGGYRDRDRFADHGERKAKQALSVFVGMVKAMRTNQRTYFKTRSRESLKRSIEMETDVDQWLNRYLEDEDRPLFAGEGGDA